MMLKNQVFEYDMPASCGDGIWCDELLRRAVLGEAYFVYPHSSVFILLFFSLHKFWVKSESIFITRRKTMSLKKADCFALCIIIIFHPLFGRFFSWKWSFEGAMKMQNIEVKYESYSFVKKKKRFFKMNESLFPHSLHSEERERKKIIE